MDQRTGQIILNGAPSQHDRRLPALGGDYAPVDGRSFAELLDFPVKFGALLNFYDLDDRVDGDWVGFFASDPTMILAALATADPDAMEREFVRLERLTQRVQVLERKFELLCAVFAFIQGIARRINDALMALDPPPGGSVGAQLWELLVSLITRSLRAELQRLKDDAEGAGLPQALGRPVPLDWHGFLAIWGLRDGCPDGAIYRGRSPGRKIDHALPHLASIFAAFRDAFADLADFARANLEASLAAPYHKPQIGLFIAFARLFETAQATVNQTSDRFRHFYYEDVLRGRPAGPVPDEVYLTFALAAEEGVSRSTVPAKTLFPAGQDADGRDILYASDRALTVTAAAIAQVRTLRVLRGPLVLEPFASLSGVEEASVVRRVLGSEVAFAQAAAQSIAWPIFGAEAVGLTEVTVTTPATLGFAVTSSCLLLTGGTRQVQLIVGYSQAFQVEQLYPRLEQLAAIVGSDPATIFRQILEGAFTVEASTAMGWFEVTPYTAVVPREADPAFTLCFTLPPTAPPLVAIDPAAAAASEIPPPVDPAPGRPTLKVHVRQQPVVLTPPPGSAGPMVQVYPLSLLDGMDLETFEIAIDVAGLAGGQLQNTEGSIDQTSPFPLFGASAVVGSYLEIRHEELFAKQIATLQLGIAWFDLPQNADGFKGYYRDYVIGLDGKPQPGLFDNSIFRVAIEVRNPGSWTIDGDGSPPAPTGLCLFRTLPLCDTTEPAAPLCPHTVFAFGEYEIGDHVAPPYYRPADSALMVRLTAPAYGFGDDLYSVNVLNAVIADLPDPDDCKQACEAECAVLKTSAEAISACVEECSLEPDDKFRACITDCLARCVDELVLSALECLLHWLLESRGTLGEARFATVSASFDAARTADPGTPASERAARLRQWIDSVRALPGIDTSCLEKCLSLLQAAVGVVLCVSGCQSESPETYRACVLPGLKDCIAQLEDAYALCFQRCVDACMKPHDPMKYPNAPWLPMAQGVTVGYSARCVLFGPPESLAADNRDAPAGEFFHLLPFGGYAAVAPPTTLLPAFPDEGSLYLGLAGLTVPQGLTLLFEMGGSRDSGQAPVAWELLCADSWMRLEGAQIVADGTNGLQNSGILGLSLPACAVTAGTVMPGETSWLRGTVRSGASRFAPAIGMYPNAATARWQEVSGTGETLGRPLPPHTITSSVEPLPDIASINQPIESSGGRPPETASEFEIRLGERLRHKDRAIVSWDYERLVLEQFPTIWKVQALPARAPWGGAAPAYVLVVVVAGPDSREVIDPTAPTASPVLLDAIRARLQGVASPFVRLSVVNPVYVRIEVVAVVGFADTEDAGGAITRLNDELVRYLSPWFYDPARAALGGRYIDEDAISTFIETRPYVDELWELRLCYDPPTDGLEWFFLTSARQHAISQPPAAAAVGLLEESGT